MEIGNGQRCDGNAGKDDACHRNGNEYGNQRDECFVQSDWDVGDGNVDGREVD